MSEKSNRFDMYKKTTTICDIMYYDVLNKANIKKRIAYVNELTPEALFSITLHIQGVSH